MPYDCTECLDSGCCWVCHAAGELDGPAGAVACRTCGGAGACRACRPVVPQPRAALPSVHRVS